MTEKIPTQNFVEEYRVLYHAFHQLNRLCWQNRLPLCRIEIYSHRGMGEFWLVPSTGSLI